MNLAELLNLVEGVEYERESDRGARFRIKNGKLERKGPEMSEWEFSHLEVNSILNSSFTRAVRKVTFADLAKMELPEYTRVKSCVSGVIYLIRDSAFLAREIAPGDTVIRFREIEGEWVILDD